MRHKYETRAIVLARAPAGEQTAQVTLLTHELGLVRARAQSLRRSGARLAAALTTYAESDVVLVRGKGEWRVAGAVLAENWFRRLPPPSRERAARTNGLLLRLVAGEARDTELYPVVTGYLRALATLPEDAQEGAEALAALYLLRALGLDAGALPGASGDFSPELVGQVAEMRAAYVARVNEGIGASGL